MNNRRYKRDNRMKLFLIRLSFLQIRIFSCLVIANYQLVKNTLSPITTPVRLVEAAYRK